MASTLLKDAKGKILWKDITKEVFIKGIEDVRLRTGKDIEGFKFNKSRCKILTKEANIKKNCKGILYWMLRDCRVQDNWAMLFAQKLARKNKVPLFVCFFAKPLTELYPTKRQYNFLMKGLAEVSEELNKLNINFSLVNATPIEELVNIVKQNDIGGVICDLMPLRVVKDWTDNIINELPEDVPLVQVDAHNIVPLWIASEKEEIAARTIRSKIQKKLPEFFEGFPCVSSHEYTTKKSLELGKKDITFDHAMKNFKSDVEVEEVSWAKPGTTAGLHQLYDFIKNRLKYYGDLRNDPSKDAQSNLSPWLHFGFISAQRCALEVKSFKTEHNSGVEGFLEESIIRRELADNYCYYNENYDNIEGTYEWAKNTLKLHKSDKRTYVYTKEQFEKGLSHEHIWNAAQMQLVKEGKLHGYMRMYWCKKILEWTASPEEAIKIGLYLNDYYSLDGSDPNGFVGVMWSICGVHDHGWTERPIFGKIRFMVEYSLLKKFDAEAYMCRYLSNEERLQQIAGSSNSKKGKSEGGKRKKKIESGTSKKKK